MFALHTPRNVPLPLRKKVKDELKRMESLEVISKVDTPTPWCAGMVVVTALTQIQSAKVTLNKEKCEFGKTSM